MRGPWPTTPRQPSVGPGWRTVAVGALVALVALAGCGDTPSAPATGRHPHAVHRTSAAGHHRSTKPTPSHSAASPTRAPARPPGSGARVARAALGRLVVRPRPVGTRGYLREAFGTDWVDTDHNGCNQRDDVLLRDAVPGSTRVAQQDACDHDVLAGTWHDPYTGRTLRFTDLKELSQAEAIQIDHVVPLAEAWVSGAAGWSTDRVRRSADDLHAAAGRRRSDQHEQG